MLIPLSLLIALAVDLGGALAYRTWQGSLLESTRQSCFGEANAVKYAENPGDEARSEVLEMLKANGYTGKATVYYVEAPESTTVWRPADTGNGWCEYTIDKEGSVSTKTGACSLDDAPEILSKAVRDMLP